MDWITHAAIGAAVGEIILGKRLGNRALGWGALVGIVPDLLDALASPFLGTSAKLAHLYGASHSLLLMGLLLLALPGRVARRWKRSKVTSREIALFVGIAWLAHLLVDGLSVRGVQVLWPYRGLRASFGVLDQRDGWFAAPLVLALVCLAFLQTKKEQRKRRRYWRWGVGMSGGYLALALLAKWAASAGFAADLARRGTPFQRRMEAPTSWNILLWRGMVDCGDEIWVGYRTVFEWHSTPVLWTVYPRNREAFAKFSGNREARRVDEFCNGWWIARGNNTGVWLADLRSGEQRLWGEKKGMVDNRIKRSWHLEPDAPGDPLRQITPGSKAPGEMAKRLIMRTFGLREAWDASPRLAGVPGALPERLWLEP